MGEELRRLPDEEARVEDVTYEQQPPLARGIATQRPMHAEYNGKKNKKTEFNEKH
jgi:hypothetical protein